MATKTFRYELIKPEMTDPADITAINENWNKIEAQFKQMTYAGSISTSFPFNSAISQGEYAVAGSDIPNAPVTGALYGKLLVYVSTGDKHDNANNWIWHIFFNTSHDQIWIRKKLNNYDWGAWYQLYSTVNKPKLTDLSGTLPIDNGGTGAINRKESFYNLACLGVEPITSTADDTPTNWVNLGTGYAWYGSDNHLIDQKSSYAILVSLTYGSDLTQFWIIQPFGRIYKRAGSQAGWNSTWHKIYDEENKPTVAEIGAASATHSHGDLTTVIYSETEPTPKAGAIWLKPIE